MLKNYFTVILRNLYKQKIFSFINISGLAIAIAISILVILYIENELTYDQFHKNHDRIFRPYTHVKAGEREAIRMHTPFIMATQLKENYSDIIASTILTEFNSRVSVEDQSFNERMFIASQDFYRIFDFKTLHGTTQGALHNPSSLIITRKIAKKYFGRENVINEPMTIQIGSENKIFKIEAVLDDIPSNSSIRFPLMISDHHLKDIFPEPMLRSWNMITGETFVLLEKNVNSEQLVNKFPSLVEQVMGDALERMDYTILLQPLSDIHLNTDLPPGNLPVTDPKYMVILSAIAGLILIIACINFILLSLGRSFMRAREIGIRKSTGATRAQIMTQFLGESIFIAVLGLIVGIILVYITLPLFNEVSNQYLVLKIDLLNAALIILLTLITGILSGLYPALIMSGFKPVKILRGNIKVGKGKNALGTFLVLGQFILFIILIGCTLIMHSQLQYIRNKNLGYNKENVMVVEINTGNARGVREVVKKGFEKARLFENAVKNIPEVISSGIASHTFEPGTWTQIGYESDDGEVRNFTYNTIGPGFIPTMNITMVSGRNFNDENPNDFNRSVIVNEAFVHEFSLERGVGERIPNGEFEDHEIIGVVENFHVRSLHSEIQPLMLAMNVDLAFSGANRVDIGSSERPKLFIRFQQNDINRGVKAVEEAFKSTFPEDAFVYEFVDEQLMEQYEREQNLSQIVTASSILAILIGCMGIFGLSLLSFAGRLKEISIRKVLGASDPHILYVLSKRFIFLILIALIISIPVTSKIMMNWLDEFAYSIRINPGIFLLAGIISLLLMLITLSFQGINALKTNPAEILRNE